MGSAKMSRILESQLLRINVGNDARPTHSLPTGKPDRTFHNFEPRNPPIGVLELQKTRRSTDFEALKLRMFGHGSDFFWKRSNSITA